MNILYFVWDSQRASNLSIYGYGKHTTPHLGALAETGVVYENHISTSPWCLPAYASLMTGKYSASHGATVRFENLTTEHLTLPEVFSRHDYQTAAFSSNSYMSENVGLERGFQHFEFLKAAGDEAEDKGAAEMESRVAKWLHAADPDRPFFLFINSNETHWPYWAPEPYRFLFMPEGLERDPARFQDIAAKARVRPNLADAPLTEEEWAIVRGLYDGETARADGSLNTVMDALRASGRFDDTLIVVTSDHGEDQGEHIGFLTHSYGLYQTVLHIPLVISQPGRVPAGVRFSGLTQPVDIFPTLLSMAGLDDEEWHSELQGFSLLPTFEGTAIRDTALAEYQAPLQKLERDLRLNSLPSRFERKRHRALKSIEDGKHKFIWASDGDDELFDLRADPGETNNLIEEQPEKALELYQLLDKWLMSHAHRDYGDAINVHPIKGVQEESLRRLEAWGLLRHLHALPFGSGHYLSETIG